MPDEVTLKIKIDGGQGASASGGDPATQSRRDTLLARGQQVATLVNTARSIMRSQKPTEVIVVGSRVGALGSPYAGQLRVNQGGVIGMARQPGGGYILPGPSQKLLPGPTANDSAASGLMASIRRRAEQLREKTAENTSGLIERAQQLKAKTGSTISSLASAGGTGALAAGRAMAGKALSAAGGAAAGTVGSLATGAMSALGPLAAVAAGAVGVVLAFKAVSAAATALSDDIKRRTDELAQYSATIQQSRAQSEIRKVQKDVKEAQVLGEPLSRYEDSTGRIGMVFDSFLASIENIFLRVINPPLELIASLMEGFAPVLDGINSVVKFLDESGLLQLMVGGAGLMTPIYETLKIIAKIWNPFKATPGLSAAEEFMQAGERMNESSTSPSSPPVVGTGGFAPSFAG